MLSAVSFLPFIASMVSSCVWVSCVVCVAKKSGSWPSHCIKLGVCIPKVRTVVLVNLFYAVLGSYVRCEYYCSHYVKRTEPSHGLAPGTLTDELKLFADMISNIYQAN